MSGHTPGRLMELATDFGVESLRVGSYEARKEQVGNGRIEEVRCKREQARRKLKNEVDAVFSERDELLNALRPLITKRMGAEQIREGIQRAIARAAIAKVEP